MKKITLFLLLYVSLLSTTVIAANSATKHHSKDSKTPNYTLNFGDLAKYSEKEIKAEIRRFLKVIPTDDPECSVTVKGLIDESQNKFEISVTISGSCRELKSKGKEIAYQILNETKHRLDDSF